jgi:hypothetical protein
MNIDESTKLLLDVHIAEYHALTTRATNYIVMGKAIWPLMLSFIGALIAIWEHLSPWQSDKYGFVILVWGGLLGIQLILILWTFLVYEQYRIVRYTEKELAPLVVKIIGTSDFWQYEKKIQAWASINKKTPRSANNRIGKAWKLIGKTRKLIGDWFELQTEFWILAGLIVIILIRIWNNHYLTSWDGLGIAANLIIFSVLLYWAVIIARIHQQWALEGAKDGPHLEAEGQIISVT